MDTFTRGDLVFDVTDSGDTDGEVVVLLHGFPQNRHEWDAVTPHLIAGGHRVLAPDQRGYSPGARPAGRRSYVQSELVDDIVALIDASGAEKVHLVGHDWGALVAWAFASRHPERLHTLTAVSVPHPKAFAWAMPRGQILKSWYMAAFQLPALPERFLPSRRGLVPARRCRADPRADVGLPRAARSRRVDRCPELVPGAAVVAAREGLRPPLHGADHLRVERR